MKLIVKSLMNWKFLLLVFALAGLLVFFSSNDVAHAQTDCVDPATGAACTPVPPGPTCGVAGTPPCEPPPPTVPPPPSGCTDAAGNPCTPVPPPPSQPEPTNTPRPRPTRTTAPTATFTATPTTYIVTRKETATPTPLGMTTATIQYAFPKTTPTSLVDIPAPFIPPPKPVTLKSQKSPWGWVVDMVNWLFTPSTNYEYGTDVFWVGNIVAIQKTQGTCVGGSCLNGMGKAKLGQNITVYVSPWSEWYGPGSSIPEILEEPLIALCQGTTGRDGCDEPRYFSGKNKYYDYYLVLLGLPWESQDRNIPAEWVPKAGTYQFTAYVNYNQDTVPEFVYHNNFKTFTVIVEAPTTKYGNISNLPTPTQTLEPSDNPYYFDNSVVVLQNNNCIQGCSLTPGWVIAGQPVEVYLQGYHKPYNIYNINGNYFADPLKSAMVACEGVTGQNGCTDPLPVDTPSYTIPQWFLKSQYGNLLNNKPNIARFTIPGNWIPSTGLYAVTFYVNYNQQASPEVDMSDNFKTIYLNASALQQP